jgi:tRNA pseudouridine38-40 synthase
MKYALGIEYDGHEFHGWQAQDNLPTVQGHLEAALTKIAAQPIKVICAGRTDAGVHATGQVVHFETTAQREARAWTLGVNTCLPPTIAVRWIKEVEDDFQARFSATARRYRYLIYNHTLRSALFAKRATWYFYPLDAEKMQQAGQYLLGEQDFSSFRSSDCESKTPMRNVHSLTVTRQNELVVVEIQANAFLHHMVRNIVGVLLQVGAGFKEPVWAQEVLQAKDRRAAAETAPPEGLYLTQVIYPEVYNLLI